MSLGLFILVLLGEEIESVNLEGAAGTFEN
jgi:hypothetical protein